ncbi:MAG: ribosome recycling factor [Eubacteriales bacterium]|nr:ribosome recycling factor [Eubacteriales bacterium]
MSAAAGFAPDRDKYEARMKKTIEVLESEFSTIRAGRANPAVLDRITVEYYGSPTPLAQVASISAPEPRVLAIQPWDASTLKGIEKAILTSDLGINPQNDGRIIRLIFPPLTEERRRELIKQVKKLAEDAKVAIRNVRREAMDAMKKKQKASEITEDELKKSEKDLQDLTDKYTKKIDDLCAAKEKELLAI